MVAEGALPSVDCVQGLQRLFAFCSAFSSDCSCRPMQVTTHSFQEDCGQGQFFINDLQQDDLKK